ncbi:MAG: hypothetical protein ACI8RD_012436, partial [Bacillariaceae sp.]
HDRKKKLPPPGKQVSSTSLVLPSGSRSNNLVYLLTAACYPKRTYTI